MPELETAGARYINASHNIRDAWVGLVIGIVLFCIALICRKTGRIWSREGMINRSESPEYYWFEVISLFSMCYWAHWLLHLSAIYIAKPLIEHWQT